MSITVLNPQAPLDIHVHRLPHWQQHETACFATWRLDDAVPQSMLREWKEERRSWLSRNPTPLSEQQWKEYHHTFTERIDRWLDEGLGSKHLAEASHAEVVEQTLRHFDGERYVLYAFVIMPTHVHVLFSPVGGQRVNVTMQAWKSVSARRLMREHGCTAPVWQAGYWDRLIRSRAHFEKVVEYIRENPRKAGIGEGSYRLYVANHLDELGIRWGGSDACAVGADEGVRAPVGGRRVSIESCIFRI